MIPLDTLESLVKRCPSTDFFEMLVKETKKAGIKGNVQRKLRWVENGVIRRV
jgi:hypothetical protein